MEPYHQTRARDSSHLQLVLLPVEAQSSYGRRLEDCDIHLLQSTDHNHCLRASDIRRSDPSSLPCLMTQVTSVLILNMTAGAALVI